MTDLIIKNANLLTMSNSLSGQSYGLIENGAIAIEAGKITWLGKTEEAPNSNTVVDAKGQFLSPALIDCHTHLVFAGSRAHEFEQRLTGVSYEEIAKQGGGIISTVNATRNATEQELLELALPRVKQLMAEGVACIEIKSGYGLDTSTELKMLRVARQLADLVPVKINTTFLAAHAVPPEYKDNADAYIDLICEQMLPLVAEENLADAVDGFCEGIGFSPEQMRKVFDKAQELGIPVKLHAEQLSDLSGASLVAEYQGLSADHLEYLSEQSIMDMAKADTTAVLLPGAFYTLSETKLPPIDLLRKHKVAMAVASDYNPGSSPLCSLKLMLHMACTQFKMTPEEALAGITKNAAKALAENNKGTIEVGKDADLCLWDIQHPAELSYTFGVNPLSHFWINGVEQMNRS